VSPESLSGLREIWEGKGGGENEGNSGEGEGREEKREKEKGREKGKNPQTKNLYTALCAASNFSICVTVIGHSSATL